MCHLPHQVSQTFPSGTGSWSLHNSITGFVLVWQFWAQDQGKVRGQIKPTYEGSLDENNGTGWKRICLSWCGYQNSCMKCRLLSQHWEQPKKKWFGFPEFVDLIDYSKGLNSKNLSSECSSLSILWGRGCPSFNLFRETNLPQRNFLRQIPLQPETDALHIMLFKEDVWKGKSQSRMMVHARREVSLGKRLGILCSVNVLKELLTCH